VGAAGVLGGEQLGGASGGGGLGGAVLLLAQRGKGQGQATELVDELQELAGVGGADEVHAA